MGDAEVDLLVSPLLLLLVPVSLVGEAARARVRYPLRPRLRHVHSSSRFDRTPVSLLRAAKWYIQMADLVTFTEVANNARVRALRHLPGWGFAQVEAPGQDECALLYLKVKWRLVSVETRRLSEGEIARGVIYALVVVLEHRRTKQLVVVSVAHLPAHVEGNFRDFNPQVPVYKECLTELAHMVTDWRANQHYDGILIVADWNLSWRLEWVRDLIHGVLPGLRCTWGADRLPPKGVGTHGPRPIDYTLTDLLVLKAAVTKDDPSSDHRPYREVLLLPKAA